MEIVYFTQFWHKIKTLYSEYEYSESTSTSTQTKIYLCNIHFHSSAI